MRIVAALLIAFAVIFGAGQLAPASARADGDQCFSHFIYYGLVPTGVTERTCYHPDGSYQLCRYGGFMGNGWCQDFPAPPGPPPGVGVPPVPAPPPCPAGNCGPPPPPPPPQ